MYFDTSTDFGKNDTSFAYISFAHNEAVEKPDFEPSPPPFALIYLLSRSSG
ncbi:hypothetical protein KUC_3022 [Vreelandella boliviensis LC1]|uniref:Uncharacterized protein n=1 Tax=Vreelandella boliviensis LC1 TaxID=1072583 RepID=A0A7U9GEF0_9GAMM|nr:hypothetical protein KUC_3022 [Halomonas boliviensis LC1]